MASRRTFYKTSAAARAANHDHPTRALGRPIENCDHRGIVLSHRQWKCAAEAMAVLAKRQRGNCLAYTTAAEIAVVVSVSHGTARRALRALHRVGLLRMHPANGSRPEMYLPAAWP